MKKILFILLLLQLMQCKPAADIDANDENVDKPLPNFSELNSESHTLAIIDDRIIYYVTASPCLNVRTLPSISSEIIDKLDINTSVIKIKRLDKTDKINGKAGYWVEIEYSSDKTGWVFDAYLKKKEDTVKLELEKLYSEFKSIEQEKDIEKLMALHKRIESFLNNIDNYSQYSMKQHESAHYEVGTHYEYEDERWKELGIMIFKHNSRFSSFNRMLNLIHDINPHSKYREQTLYAEVIRSDGAIMDSIPNIKAGLEYIDDFPDGPHLAEVYMALARIYTDLYNVTKDPDTLEWLGGAYGQYIDKTPLNVQIEKNKKNAYYFLKKYRELKPDEDTSYFERLYLREKSDHFFYISM